MRRRVWPNFRFVGRADAQSNYVGAHISAVLVSLTTRDLHHAGDFDMLIVIQNSRAYKRYRCIASELCRLNIGDVECAKRLIK